MSNFFQIEGEKRGSKLWVHNGKGYVKERETPSSLFLRCRQFKKDNCKGRAVIRADVDLMSIKNEHCDDCSDSAEIFEIIDLKSNLKRKAEKTSTSLRQLFNDGVENSSVADQINYPQLMDSMNKRRRLMTPVLPYTPMEASQIVVSDRERFGKHFRSVVDGPNHSDIDPEMSLIFVSDRMGSLMDEGRINFLQLDATFAIVPQIFYQHLTIMGEMKDHLFPLVHILMTKKEQSLYEATFHEIVRLFPNLAPSHFIMDFERALENSVKKVFLNVRISGCRFHLSQAIYRKVTKLGLSKVYEENKSFHNWVKRLMALALLPTDSITPTYEMLASEPIQMLTLCEKHKLNKLKTYYKKYWLKQVGSQKISVFGLRRKTHNDLEIYNRWIKNVFQSHHPNFYRYLDALNKNVSVWDRNINSLMRGIKIRRESNKKSIENEKRSRIQEQKLSDGLLTPITFIHSMTRQIDECFDDVFSNEDEEVYSDDSETEAAAPGQDRPLCPVCMDRAHVVDTAFIPCGHTNCFDCATHIKNAAQHCPICRQDVREIMRVIFS